MNDEAWALCQWVVELAGGAWPRSLSRKKRVIGLDTHRFLATEAYLELLPEWREKLLQETRAQERQEGAARPERKAIDAEAARSGQAVAFVLAQLADPELTDDEKAKIRARWSALHPDNPAPWSADDLVDAGEAPRLGVVAAKTGSA